MTYLDWAQRTYSDGQHTFTWTAPRFDRSKNTYRSTLRGVGPPDDAFQTEITISPKTFSETIFRARIVRQIEQQIRAAEESDEVTLGEYLFAPAKWEEIRRYSGWSTDTARAYRNILQNVFASVLVLPRSKVKPSDITDAINVKCNVGTYKASTIRTWYKVINRVFAYLTAAFPGSENPVRMRGKAYIDARHRQKIATAARRISQTSLYDAQQRTMLFAFLQDIRNGDFRGVAGVMMLESGRRPAEAGATTLGMHIKPPGEACYSAPCFEISDGTIVDLHKTARADRQIPDSPVLAAVYEHILKRVKALIGDCSNIDWRTIPFGFKAIYRGKDLIQIKPYTSRQISAYVRQKLEENQISLQVMVDRAEDDSDDNRRAYILRYTAATGLYGYLPLDVYQYVMGHRRGAYANSPETTDISIYASPQIQSKIYAAMKARDEDVYGIGIVDDVKNFLAGENL